MALGTALTPLKRPSLALVACRWRWEIAIVSAISAGIAAVTTWAGTSTELAATAALAVTAGVAATRREVRRFATTLAWCVITPHRIRTCFAQAWIYNRAGRIPAVLRATVMPFGERVVIWCPAGISSQDIHSACELLAVACWATEVTARRSRRLASVVYLDVIRRSQAHPSLTIRAGTCLGHLDAVAVDRPRSDRRRCGFGVLIRMRRGCSSASNP